MLRKFTNHNNKSIELLTIQHWHGTYCRVDDLRYACLLKHCLQSLQFHTAKFGGADDIDCSTRGLITNITSFLSFHLAGCGSQSLLWGCF